MEKPNWMLAQVDLTNSKNSLNKNLIVNAQKTQKSVYDIFQSRDSRNLSIILDRYRLSKKIFLTRRESGLVGDLGVAFRSRLLLIALAETLPCSPSTN